ncbi:MAG TPA: protein-disulfide reductase DsbD [Lysobacter sp.]|nr:protein-disulfide reductase DsbD [Lysobacter sp.]
MSPTLYRFARRAQAAALALLALLAAAPAAALDPEDLLPVDQAFVLSAQADGADAIVIRWKIADGYYLYRHRTSAKSDAGFAAQPLQLPKGKAHVDEFFGKVETYRGELVARLPGQAQARSAQLTVKYQGCADAGICYPPQTRTLTVALPAGPEAPHAPGLRRGGLLGAAAAPLEPEQAFGFEAIVGDADTLLLRFSPAPGYYLYRDHTKLALAGAHGVRLGAPRWPKATAWKDEHFGDVAVFFDPIDVPVPLVGTRREPATATLTATFQGCQTDGICYPLMTRTVSLQLPAGGSDVSATAVAEATSPAAPQEAAAPVAVPDSTDTGGVAAGASVPATAPADAGTPTDLGLLPALLLALLGGVILNLMPCVLPVLSLKALSIAGSGQDPARARRQAFAYTAGVLVSFAALGAAALALREAGMALGWGFQLQQPLVVALLALVMFALGLSLSGVWHLGGGWVGIGHGLATRGGLAGDFFTGVLAVVVATPCTAPFMGAAMAWAFTAPTATALAVFLALGLGLALPFLLIGLVPALAQRLPRPGAWMDTLKQLLAFPLYATAAWLAWVLARQRGADAVGAWLLAALLLALALWAWTRARHGRRWALALAAIALLAALWPLRLIHTMPRPQQAAPALAATGALTPVPFSEQRLADLRASGRPVFVNITADWCITCKANERAVFARDGFARALQAAGGVYMVGDWTDVDPALTAYLQRYKAVGVPLYVVYPRGGGPGRVLPALLTPGLVDEALAQAAGG